MIVDGRNRLDVMELVGIFKRYLKITDESSTQSKTSSKCAFDAATHAGS
jgi:hypothetical protein